MALIAAVVLASSGGELRRFAPGADAAFAATDGLAANPALQDAIRRVARAQGKGDLAVALADLRRLSAPDFSDLVPQLAIFLLSASGDREGMAPAVIAQRLGITRQQILRGVEPHLGVSDPALRPQLENLLGEVDRGPGGGVDFSEYRIFLGEKDHAPSSALVRYLFKRSPNDAVTVLAGVEKSGGAAGGAVPAEVSIVEARRSELAATGRLSEEARADATVALEALAQSPDWWLRCYAAAIARAEPRLAGASAASTRERLARDPDARVRAVVEGEGGRRG